MICLCFNFCSFSCCSGVNCGAISRFDSSITWRTRSAVSTRIASSLADVASTIGAILADCSGVKSNARCKCDQAKPQIEAIHKEAMEKTHAIMGSTRRADPAVAHPAATAKYDAMKKAHEDMRKAMRELHEAKKM